MIIAGQLITSCASDSVRLEPGWLELDGGLIVNRGTGRCPHQIDLGGDDTLISPGFIDAHVHLPQFDIIGAEGMTLLDWLRTIVSPAEMRWEDAGFAEAMIARVYRQFISAGTTSFLAFATVHHQPAILAMEMAQAQGFRCSIGQVLMDRNWPDELIRPAAQLASEAEKILTWADGAATSRVSGALAPRFALSCSEALLDAAGRLARQFHPLIETHLAETQPDCDLAKRLFPGSANYTQVYDRFGLVTRKTLLGHCVWIDEGERRMLAERQAVAVHCPTANTFLSSGSFALAAARPSHLRLAIGSDIGAGYERSMIRVAKAAVETAIHRQDPPPTAEQMWWQITAGNALALGWESFIGRLEPGMEADLCVIQPTIRWQNAPSPLGAVFYGWDDRWLQHVIISGRVVDD